MTRFVQLRLSTALPVEHIGREARPLGSSSGGGAEGLPTVARNASRPGLNVLTY
jgi:hypothetical protein